MDGTPTNTPGPRRSQRERKVVKPYASVNPASGKRKRKTIDDAEEVEEEVTDEGEELVQDEASDGEPKGADEVHQTSKSKRKRGKTKETKVKGGPPAKRPRTTETEDEGHTSGGDDADASEEDGDNAKTPTKAVKKGKTTNKTKAKRPRQPKAAGAAKKPKITGRRGRRTKDGEAYDAEQVAKDTKISADNPLFNAVVDPASALQDTVEDFFRSLKESPEAAQAELINLILRSCGCNDSVDSNQAVDYDGVVDALDNFTEVLKQENSPVYPLTSKLAVFKKFRKSLSEFVDRLVTSGADLGLLYTSDLMATLQTWVIAMSSSQIRSFRHTATVVALEVETSLCDVAAAVDKEAEVVSRQREGEKKRKGSGKGANAREKELEAKAREIRERRTKLAEYLKEFVDGVFVHRYRDLDHNIRAECVRAIGLWFSKYPNHFLDASYLRYVGWVLSDANTHVRLEAVKSLSSVYEQDDYIGSLSHFTERFKPRLLEMATSDIELSVRVAVIQVLEALDAHALLEEEEREKLCLLVFDEEVKVRKAVGGFVLRVWKENSEERVDLGRKGKGRKKDKDNQEKYEERVGLKSLVALFEKWGKALNELDGDVDDSENGDDVLATGREGSDSGDGPLQKASRRKEVSALVGTDQKGRIALAVEALWDEVEAVKDWEGILEMLLLDHSSGSSEGRTARVNGKGHTPPDVEADTGPKVVIHDSWRLEEGEETNLLGILVASVRQTKADVAGGKKSEDETVANDITRELIAALPRLFIKYQTDQHRIADVLQIPTLMNLDLYLEMRMISAYNALWDDIIKQFMSHTSVKVLTHAIRAIRYLMESTSLSNANGTKILELEDELATALRDTVGGRDEIEVATLGEDEALALGAHCTRIGVLFGIRNLTSWMEEDESGKQSSAWDIVSALAERGRLGYGPEEHMVEQSLQVLTLHIMWKSKDIPKAQEGQEFTADEEKYRDTFQQQRDSLVEKLAEFVVGAQSNTAEDVKRAAFKHYLDLHVLFAPVKDTVSGNDSEDNMELKEKNAFSMTLDDESQYRCAGYIQAEIERFAEILEEGGNRDATVSKHGSDDEMASGEDEDPNERSKSKEAEKEKKASKKLKHKEVDTESRSYLEREYLFIDVISTFLRALHAGAIDLRHGAVLLAHYGRLGYAFDTCVKIVVDDLRDEGLLGGNCELIVNVVTQAIEEAFGLVMDGYVEDEYNAVQLAKLLSSCYIIRGSQLSIVKRLDGQYVVQVQMNLLNWNIKRLTAYQKNKNKQSLRKTLLFFRVLIPLLKAVQNRDALKIKAHLDQALDQAKVEVSPTLKAWEPYRSYEKRLSNILNKDKVGEGRRRKAGKGTASGGEFTTDEESGGERLGETDGEQTKPSQPRPKPVRKGLRRTRANPNPEPGGSQDEQEQTNEETEREDNNDATMVTPKANRTLPAPIATSTQENASQHDEVPVYQMEVEPMVIEPLTPAKSTTEKVADEVTVVLTPKPISQSRKRIREDDEETTDNTNNESPSASQSQQSVSPAQNTLSTPVDEVHVRRKRLRR